MFGRELNKDHPVWLEKRLSDHRLRAELGHRLERSLELIGTFDQNRRESKTGPRGCHIQVFHEDFAEPAVCGSRCRENPRRRESSALAREGAGGAIRMGELTALRSSPLHLSGRVSMSSS